jgi:hypothetical protein
MKKKVFNQKSFLTLRTNVTTFAENVKESLNANEFNSLTDFLEKLLLPKIKKVIKAENITFHKHCYYNNVSSSNYFEFIVYNKAFNCYNVVTYQLENNHVSFRLHVVQIIL